MPPHEKILVVGSGGGGKTFQAKREADRILRENHRAGNPLRLCVLDPTGGSSDGWHPSGAVIVRDRGGFLDAWESGARRIVVRGLFRDWSPAHEFERVLWVVDEAHEFASATQMDPSFSSIVLRGRHLGSSWIAITQRVNDLNPRILVQKPRVILLSIVHPCDRSRIEKALGVKLPRVMDWRPVREGGDPLTDPVMPIRWPEDFTPEGKWKGYPGAPIASAPRASS